MMRKSSKEDYGDEDKFRVNIEKLFGADEKVNQSDAECAQALLFSQIRSSCIDSKVHPDWPPKVTNISGFVGLGGRSTRQRD